MYKYCIVNNKSIRTHGVPNIVRQGKRVTSGMRNFFRIQMRKIKVR